MEDTLLQQISEVFKAARSEEDQEELTVDSLVDAVPTIKEQVYQNLVIGLITALNEIVLKVFEAKAKYNDERAQRKKEREDATATATTTATV